ncbi:hypothetical protein NCCP691_26730 [Noviherbaspirillum aridicola]|uniref:HTH cro/C1-type domain-containing protein n=2 Tax=Noviherbaspirillum aridicola TaxID=2849687 RepID=A0ABQ4Q6J0_9BURK|nr:hypothetical protein NCCP691_26730 [Noviherbaspirillum aridicola]
MTQEELAVRAGLSRRTLIAVEAGKTDITLTRLLSVLSVLGLEIGLTEAARTKRRPRESELLEIFGEDE